jgi:hypothetical protein
MSFDTPNLVSHAGLVAIHVRPGEACGVSAPTQVGCLVAGMSADADPVDDMYVLRHAAVSPLFGGIRAPSTMDSLQDAPLCRTCRGHYDIAPEAPGRHRLRIAFDDLALTI